MYVFIECPCFVTGGSKVRLAGERAGRTSNVFGVSITRNTFLCFLNNVAVHEPSLQDTCFPPGDDDGVAELEETLTSGIQNSELVTKMAPGDPDHARVPLFFEAGLQTPDWIVCTLGRTPFSLEKIFMYKSLLPPARALSWHELLRHWRIGSKTMEFRLVRGPIRRRQLDWHRTMMHRRGSGYL